MFRVLFVDSGLPVSEATFPDAAQANAYAAEFRTLTGKRVRIAREVTEAWREREASRLADGTYKALPQWWQDAAWWQGSIPARDHFAHIATDGARIAFTESPEKGADDKQLVMSVTAYLGRFFADKLAGAEMAEIAARMEAERFKLHRSAEPEDFVKVYEDQIVYAESSNYRSCMSYNRAKYGTSVHPAYVYGAGDLEIAWIEDSAAPEFRVLARAIIWPTKRSFVRVYGVEESDKLRLISMLESEGFTRRDSFQGAELLRIEHRGGGFVVMPYIDGTKHRVSDDGETLTIDRYGEIDASETCGFAATDGGGVRCDRCEDNTPEDETYTVNGDTWCSDCYGNHGFTCESCDESDDVENAVEVHTRRDTSLWCSYCAGQNGFRCEDTGNTYSDRHHRAVEVETSTGTETWHSDSADESAFYCEFNDNHYSNRDFTSIEVTTESGIQQWCIEESEGEYFRCEDCGEYFATDLRHDDGAMFPANVCADCGAARDESGDIPALPLMPQRGRIEDERQAELAL